MKIAILRYGIEGRSAYRYFKELDISNNITIFDTVIPENLPDDTDFVKLEDFQGVDLDDFDVVIRSPSIHNFKMPNPKANVEITSVTKIFFDKCPAKIIGVTGTKGKSTTCGLIASILSSAGFKTHFVGNIGVPALDKFSEISSNDIVVYELSSFQLLDIDKSPHIAVITPIATDHLDLHGNFENYLRAKKNIVKFQASNDLVVYIAGNKYSSVIAKLSKAEKLLYPSSIGAHIKDGFFYYSNRKICNTKVLKLPGKHNLENALAAISAVYRFTTDSKIIEAGLKDFKGLPHHLELIRELNGVRYIDDSFASAIPALEAAVNSFDQSVILIAGGFDRGINYNSVSAFLKKRKNIKKIYLIGQTKEKIAAGLPTGLYELQGSLQDAVKAARQLSSEGDVILLSPGCASFDMFKNFIDRGEQFQKIVRNL